MSQSVSAQHKGDSAMFGMYGKSGEHSMKPSGFIEKSAKHSGLNRVLQSRSADFYFPLRGYSLNPMIDASSNLLALILRVKDINELDEDGVQQLYINTKNEIASIDTELREKEIYDQAMIITCRYCLCTVVDEIVLSTNWGRESHWSQNSLLSVYHGEVYGGDKIYKILTRLQMEPEKYRSLIELLYFLLSLGYRGRYGLEKDGEKKRAEILKELNSYMKINYEVPDRDLTSPTSYVFDRDFKMQVDIPVWLIFLFSTIALILVFMVFDATLTDYVNNTVQQLEKFNNSSVLR